MPDWSYSPDELYECAFCGKLIEHTGWDPCHVVVESARDFGQRPGLWSFFAHARCVPAAFSEDLRDQVADAYDVPDH
jgi:hypothetical protein